MANRAHFTILQLTGLNTTSWRVQVMLHRMFVSSTVLYDSEIDSLPQVIKMVATVFEREILRKICRLMQANRAWRTGYNEQIYRLYNAWPSHPKNRIEGCCLQWCQIESRYRTKRWQQERGWLEEENCRGHGLRMGQADKEVDNRIRRNSTTRTKRRMRGGEYRVSKCIICDYASLFWCSLTRNNYRSEVINCTYIMITA